MVKSNEGPLFPSGFPFHNHAPRFGETPSGSFKACPRGRASADSGLIDLPGLWLSQTAERKALPQGGTDL